MDEVEWENRIRTSSSNTSWPGASGAHTKRRRNIKSSREVTRTGLLPLVISRIHATAAGMSAVQEINVLQRAIGGLRVRVAVRYRNGTDGTGSYRNENKFIGCAI